MTNRISRFALVVVIAAVAGTPAVGLAYTLCGYKWAIRQVPYYINPANSDVSSAAALAALQAGAGAWSMQTNADFSFYYMGQTSGSTVARNGKNEVFFRNTNPGLTGEAYRYYDSGGKIVEFDIVLYDGGNEWFTGSSGCVSGYYVEDTATHEFGHALGLRHSNVETATMWSSVSRCGTWKRSLAPDDIAGAEAMYPGSSANAAPSVSISSPTSGLSTAEGTSVKFAGSASDKEDGTITSSMVWTSSRDGQIGAGASFARVLSVGTHTITAAATDSGGYSASRQVALTVTSTAPANTAPSVTISSPSANLVVPAGTTLKFSGTASDQEDGSLTAKLVWESNLQGPLGLGGSFTKALIAGTHTVKASVADSQGMYSTRQATVYVGSATTTILLFSSGTKIIDGILYANLKWSGAQSAKVDVYRDGVRVATAENDGTYTNKVSGKAGAVFTYKLCEAGTTTCSNDVVVRF
jgi:hypothetical protein